jgi:hypothetical protein
LIPAKTAGGNFYKNVDITTVPARQEDFGTYVEASLVEDGDRIEFVL